MNVIKHRKYKIYINEHPLMFIHTSCLDEVKTTFDSNIICLRWTNRPTTIFNCVDNLFKGSQPAIIIYGQDPLAIWKVFKALYSHVVACGGIVRHADTNDLLMIFRRNNWDLPKGKRDKGEMKRDTAVREVQEETGVQDLTLTSKWGKTYHLFKTPKGKKILKTTHWYHMTSADEELTPQVEEDIEIVAWVPLQEALQKTPIYSNIYEILVQL